ncbi:MAG: hypothetical protein K2N18_05480, partial [Clostridia bacterium]|nr:hypothetical protein [Clostridia bacterium]
KDTRRMTMAEQLHTGHRGRMRERIENNGIGELQEHEVLEYLLYSFVPRKDTNELAHRLLDEFGSLCDVMNADPEHLRKVKGMTENASLFISVMPEIFREYVVCAKHKKEKIVLDSPSKVREQMGSYFVGLNEERVYAVALDVKERIISEKVWTSKKRDKVSVEPQDILEFAQRSKAKTVIVAHNHPSGSVYPSFDDIELTEKIRDVLKLTGYNLRDNLIFNDRGEYYSFKEKRHLGNAENVLDENGVPIDNK